MYGFYPRGSMFSSLPAARWPFNIGASDLAANDMVNLVSGLVVIADTGDWLAGIAETALTASDTNQPINVTPYLTGLVDNDNDSTTFASTHDGYGFDITGGTGAQQVDTSSANNTQGAPVGTLACLDYNPQVSPYESDTSIGLFMIKEHQLYGASSA